MTTMEILEMTAKFAASIAVIFAAIALIMNTRAFKLQRRVLEASLFNEIRRRINNLEDQLAEFDQDDKEKLSRWYCRIYNAFEDFAFYANRGYLEKDMVKFFSSGIDYYVQRASSFPDLFKELKERRKGEFCELEEYYLRILNKSLPF